MGFKLNLFVPPAHTEAQERTQYLFFTLRNCLWRKCSDNCLEIKEAVANLLTTNPILHATLARKLHRGRVTFIYKVVTLNLPVFTYCCLYYLYQKASRKICCEKLKILLKHGNRLNRLYFLYTFQYFIVID